MLLCALGGLVFAEQPIRAPAWSGLSRLFPRYAPAHNNHAAHMELQAGTPSITAGSVVNAATGSAAVAPGSVARVSGNFLLSYSLGSLSGGTTLAGVSVTVGGADARLLYVSGSQIDFVVPSSVTGLSSQIIVTIDGHATAPEPVSLAVDAPGIFSINGQGNGQGAILDSANGLVDSSNPAAAGATVLKIYCTGLGPLSGNALATAPSVTVGGVTAILQSSQPGILPGITELSVLVPASVQSGPAVPVVVTAGGVTSNTVTIAVAPAMPSIASVSSVKASPSQTLTISGSGLGKTLPFTGGSPYIEIKNLTGNWSAGAAADPVTLQVESWTESTITISGFAGTYGQNGAVLNPGDSVQILVWNAQTGAGPATYYVPVGDWRLIWSDEFNGGAGTPPDPANWTYDVGASGWGNNELENYTDSTDNARMDGAGHLDIHVIKPSANVYTSARIKTEGRFNFLYGRAEALIKLPRGTGIWPAFWMLGQGFQWPFGDEIDIMENIGKDPNRVYSTIHGPYVGQLQGHYDAYGKGSSITTPAGVTLADDFHLYSVQWSPTQTTFFFDGNPFVTVVPPGGQASGFPTSQLVQLDSGMSWVFTVPNFFILNVAVGGNWPGAPDSSTVFPQDMLVDYVRVYQTGSAFVLNAWNATVPATAGSGTVSFTTTDQSAAWTASVNDATNTSWVTLTSATSGKGDGSVTYTVAPNTYAGQRSAALTVAGQTFLLNQHGTVQ